MSEEIPQTELDKPIYALETLTLRLWFADLDEAIIKFRELLESEKEQSGPEDLKVLRIQKTKQWDVIQLSTPEVYGRAYALKKWEKAHPQEQEVGEDDNGSS